MPSLIAFASLPFGMREGVYAVRGQRQTVDVHVTGLSYTPFLTITSRPELAQSIPTSGEGQGFTSYTWYDHPFVLRVVFGRNVASLGSINSCATIVWPLPDEIDIYDDEVLDEFRKPFSDQALRVLNLLVSTVRRKARLYYISDLRRDDIDITVRDVRGTMLRDDPLQADLLEQEQAETETHDLLKYDDTWYKELEVTLGKGRPQSLADELLVEAERALTQRFPRQAIATCHTALEAAASSLLTRGMHKRGLKNNEIDHTLATRSLTSKLEALLRQYTGFSLKRNNRDLWHSFNQLNDLRNDTVHRGRRPTDQDAAFAIQVTREVLYWLDMVRQRQR